MDKTLQEQVPGNVFSYSQPIELRVQELIAGVRSDLAVTLFGEDLGELERLGAEITRVVAQIPGAADAKLEQTGGLPYLRIRIKRDEIARYGINASQVLDVVQTMGGREVGEVLEGQRRFALQARFIAIRAERGPDREPQGRRPEGPADPVVAAGGPDRGGWPRANQPREHPPAHRDGGQRART